MSSGEDLREAELCGLDEPGARHAHAVQLAVEIHLPEGQKPREPRVFRCDVERLPDEGLEQARMIGHPVQDFRRRQPEVVELLFQI